MRYVWWLLTFAGMFAFAGSQLRRLRDAVPLPFPAGVWLTASLLLGLIAFAGFVLDGRESPGRLLAALVVVASMGIQFGAYFMDLAR